MLVVVAGIITIFNCSSQFQKLTCYINFLKLSNIIFSKEKNKYLIIDFGISRILDESKMSKTEQEIKMKEIIMGGTKKFSSPEKRDYLSFSTSIKSIK